MKLLTMMFFVSSIYFKQKKGFVKASEQTAVFLHPTSKSNSSICITFSCKVYFPAFPAPSSCGECIYNTHCIYSRPYTNYFSFSHWIRWLSFKQPKLCFDQVSWFKVTCYQVDCLHFVWKAVVGSFQPSVFLYLKAY